MNFINCSDKKLSLLFRQYINDIYDKMQYTFQKLGLVKYDAFHEMGGKLSFSICLLNKLNNGYIINIMHSNTGCFAYVKEIIDGKSYTELGEEEQQALEQALAGTYGSDNVIVQDTSTTSK